MVVHKLCNIAIQPLSAGHWTIFLNNFNLNNTSINSASNSSNHNNNESLNKATQSTIISPTINKPSVLSGLNSNVYSQDVSTTEPSTPTVNMMNHPNNWSINNSQQQQQLPPHFLIPAGTVPTRTLSTQQLGGVGVGAPAVHMQPNYLAAQQQQIYGQHQIPFNQTSQLNLIQQQQQQASFVQPKQQPELTTIKLKKGNHGMGLSIVAARSK